MADRNPPDRNNNPNLPPDGDFYAPPSNTQPYQPNPDSPVFDPEETLALGPDQYPAPGYQPAPNRPGETLPYNQPTGLGARPAQPPVYRPDTYASYPPYSQPDQFSPEGAPPFYPDYPAAPNAYPPPVTGPVNIPPHRRPPGYRSYQPMTRNVPPALPVQPPANYRQPPPPPSEEYAAQPPFVPAPRRIAWGEAPEPAPRRGPGWLIPVLVGLIVLLLVSGIVIIVLLTGKNDNRIVTPASVPTIIASKDTLPPPATITLAIVPTEAAITSPANTDTVSTTPALVSTPTLAVVGSPLPPTSTPGAGAATQLAIFQATVTAQANVTPTPAPTPNPATMTAQALSATTPASSDTPNASVTPDTSATPSVSASDAEQLYQTGSQAVKQAQWQAAITAFEQLENLQPKYKDTEALLVQAYTEQGKAGINDAQTAQDVQANRQYFEKALALKPNDAGIKKLIQELDYYYNGRLQYEGSHWIQAINNLSALFKLEPAYKDGVNLLYTAFLNQGDLLASQTRLAEALANYRNAVSLPVNDTSLAQQKINQIQSQLTPTATPIPPATATPVRTPTPVPTPTRVPTPTPALVNGCPIGFFNFGPFVNNSTPPYNGPDQGRSSVRGVILSTGHAPIIGAVIQIVNSGGNFSFTATSDGDGNYSFTHELGRDNWTVKLVSAPNISICFSASATVAISGQDGAQAEVSFVQTKP